MCLDASEMRSTKTLDHGVSLVLEQQSGNMNSPDPAAVQAAITVRA